MAARYWVGLNDNWDNTAGTKWATTSGGVGGAAVPTASDDVFLDGSVLSGNVTITATSVCKSLDCTGYVNTLAGSSGLSVSGLVKFVAGMTLSYTGTLTLLTTATITSGGLTIPGNITFSGSGATYTLADDWTVSGTISFSNTTSTLNGQTLFYKSLTMNVGSLGTTAFKFNTTGGTWSGSGAVGNNMTFLTNTTMSGSVVFGGASGKTLTYTSGTITTTSSTLSISLNSTLNLSGITLNNLTINNGATLSSNIDLTGTLTFGNTTNTINGFVINTKSITANTASSGTTDIVINTTGGTWSGSGAIGNNVTFSANCTISGTISWGGTGKTLTYTSGTITTTSSTLSLGVASTLDTNGISWNNVNCSVQGIITNNSLLTITGTLNYTSNGVGVTFTGTAGWTCATFTCTVAGMPHKFKSGLTYTITTAFNITASTNLSRVSFAALTAGSRANLVLNASATQNVSFVNATDIDSSAGQQVNSYKGVISNTLNWYVTNGDFLALAYP